MHNDTTTLQLKPQLKPQQSTLQHLAQLIQFDTQNPPRSITTDSPIFTYLRQHLVGFEFQFFDAGDGCISLLATRGQPELLFNFHIDTVPVAPGWDSDPFNMQIEKNTAIGLGACDIKGASACMLSACQQTTGDVALLFSSDEEHGSSQAIKHFLTTDHGFTQVIVAEPTQATAVVAHRGIQTAKLNFHGISGHASEHRALTDSAIHKATRWSSAALSWASDQDQRFDNLSGLPFNIGTFNGGIKGNMIAATCQLAFGFRPMPGDDPQQLLGKLTDPQLCDLNATDFQLIPGFTGPTLPAANQDFATAINQGRQLADRYGLEHGQAVNFWTEASLFSQADLTAIVYGPGNIAQAHTANEWVALTQLATVEQQYCRILACQNASKV